jgi:RNA polymerase primary sigma factor
MSKNENKKAVRTADNEDIVKRYLREISNIPLLSREEEIKIAQEAAQGNAAARDKLIKANLRFVVKIAKKYQNRGLPLLDLISEGNIGLVKAIDHYDVERGFHFISYAVWWVRQSILMAISEKSRLIRVPLHWNAKLIEIDKARQLFQDTQCSGNDIEKIADITGINTKMVEELVMLGQDTLSLEQPLNDRDSSLTYGELLENQMQLSPEEYAVNVTLSDEIEKVLKTLGDKEAGILRARFGHGNHRPMSQEEIGDIYHISKEGVRQIENKALKQLQASGLRCRLESYVA